jgi:hypothetical protein
LAISIKLAISIYFDCAPAISIAISIISIISIHFNLFQFISISTSELPKHFDGAPAISIVPSRHSKNGA